MLRWLSDLPPAVLFPGALLVAIAVTIGLDVAVRRFVDDDTRQMAASTAAVTLQVTATLYAILIGFVIVDEYGQLRSAQQQVTAKAAALTSVFENSRGLQPADGEPIRAATLVYAKAFVGAELPRLDHHRSPEATTQAALAELLGAVHAAAPSTQEEIASYAATLAALNSALAIREGVIGAARPTVPTALVGLLFVIGFVVMAMAMLLDTQHRRSHLVILSALAAVIGLTLAVVASMDYPFGGILHVSDGAIRTFIRLHSNG